MVSGMRILGASRSDTDLPTSCTRRSEDCSLGLMKKELLPSNTSIVSICLFVVIFNIITCLDAAVAQVYMWRDLCNTHYKSSRFHQRLSYRSHPISADL